MKVICDYCQAEFKRVYDSAQDVFLLEHPKNMCLHSGKKHVEKIL